ncbi:CopD family protein [Dictyobacter vulcani]|nr:CopD family protein [Dictyobacter vulcani]
MFTTALNSHAANRRDLWFMLPVDVLHLICAGFWVGGLMLLGLALPRALGAFAPGTGDLSRLISALIPHFSFIVMISVILLSITGVTEAVVDLGVWKALWISSYGQILLIKLAIMISLVCLLAYHLLYISPRMRIYARAIDEREANNVPGSGKVHRVFIKMQKTEALLAFCLLLSVGALTSLNPAWPAALSLPNSVTYKGTISDLTYLLAINPSKPGPNTFEVILKDRTGQPVKADCTVFLREIMLDMDMGIEQIELQPVPGHNGLYTTYSEVLSMAGHWQMTLLVRRSGFADIKKNITFSMNV